MMMLFFCTIKSTYIEQMENDKNEKNVVQKRDGPVGIQIIRLSIAKNPT